MIIQLPIPCPICGALEYKLQSLNNNLNLTHYECAACGEPLTHLNLPTAETDSAR